MQTIMALGASGGTIWQELISAITPGRKPESVSSNDHEHDRGEACVPNISPRERLKRLIGGLIPFVIALGILTWLISMDVNRLWQLPLFILFVAASSGFFQ